MCNDNPDILSFFHLERSIRGAAVENGSVLDKQHIKYESLMSSSGAESHDDIHLNL